MSEFSHDGVRGSRGEARCNGKENTLLSIIVFCKSGSSFAFINTREGYRLLALFFFEHVRAFPIGLDKLDVKCERK